MIQYNNVIEYDIIVICIYSSIFLSHKKKLKSKKGNEIWTFINVQKRKSEKSFENDPFFKGVRA